MTLSSAAIATNLHPIMLSLFSSATNPTSRPPPHVHQHCFHSPPPSVLSLPSSSSSPRHLRLSLRCSAVANGSTNLSSGAGIFAGEGFNSASDGDGEKKTNYKMKVAIVGFGNFGQFLAKEIVKQGHTVLAYSRSDYSHVAAEIGVQFFSDADDLCEEHPEVILLCSSILSTEKVLRGLPLNRLRRSTLFVDVLSVKEFPRSLFLQLLPPDFDILCTHPMFGPDSGKAGWGGLPFVFDKVRVGSDPARITRVEAFLDVFRAAGCRMVEMSCAEHDRYAAGSQFITHMMGRVLEKLRLGNTPINTKGYESLLNLVDNTARDSFELFYGLFLYNKNAMEQLERMDWAFEMVKKQLSGHLHGLVRKQLMLETNGSGNDDVNVGERNSKPMMLPSPTTHTKIVPEKQQQQQHDLVVNGSSNLR